MTLDLASGTPQDVLAVLGLVVAVAGTLISLIGLVLSIMWAPRRRNERPIVGRKVPTIRFWRPRNYNLALGNLQDFVARWEKREFEVGVKRGLVTEYDLVRWIIQSGLTCAANMVPQSLGKANLHRISQIEWEPTGKLRKVTVYSSEFDGIFTAEQLLDVFDQRLIRDISLVKGGEPSKGYPAALECIIDQRPIVQSIRRRSSRFDMPERKLGLSHVLAIPLRQSFVGALPDQPVSITVDLRYSRLVGYIADKLRLHHTLIRRAKQLSDILIAVTAIHATEFLPPSDAPPPQAEEGAARDRSTSSSETSAGGATGSVSSNNRDRRDDKYHQPPGQYW